MQDPTTATAGETTPHLVRIKDVCALIGLSKSSIYRMLRDGEFPAQVRLSEISRAFVLSEIHQWIADRVAERDAGRGVLLRGNGTSRPDVVEGHGAEVYGDARGVVLSDFNGDDRVDLVVGQNGSATRLFFRRAQPD